MCYIHYSENKPSKLQPHSICYTHLTELQTCIYACKTTVNYIVNVCTEKQMLCFWNVYIRTAVELWQSCDATQTVSLILSTASSSTGRGTSSHRIRGTPAPCSPKHRSPSQPPAAPRPAAQPERRQRSSQQAGLRPGSSPTSGSKPCRLGSPHRGAHSGPGRTHLPQDLLGSRVQVWLRAVTN